METEMNDPVMNVAYHHGNIQIRNLILMDLVVDAAPLMKTIHRTQLLNVRAQYRGRYGFNGSPSFREECYITKGDFVMLASIFNRYKEDLMARMDEDGVKKLTIGFAELAEHEQYIAELIEKNKALSQDSNFFLVSRGSEPKN